MNMSMDTFECGECESVCHIDDGLECEVCGGMICMVCLNEGDHECVVTYEDPIGW